MDPPWPRLGLLGSAQRKGRRREEAPPALSRVCGFISSQKDAAKNSGLSLDDFTLNLLNSGVTSYYLLPAPVASADLEHGSRGGRGGATVLILVRNLRGRLCADPALGWGMRGDSLIWGIMLPT